MGDGETSISSAPAAAVKSMAISAPFTLNANAIRQPPTARLRAFLLAESLLGGQPGVDALADKAGVFSAATFADLRNNVFRMALADFTAVYYPDDDDEDADADMSSADDVSEASEDEEPDPGYGIEDVRREFAAIAEWPERINVNDVRDVFVSETPTDRLAGLETWLITCLMLASPAIVVDGNIAQAGVAAAVAIDADRDDVFWAMSRGLATPMAFAFVYPAIKAAARRGHVGLLDAMHETGGEPFHDMLASTFCMVAADAAEFGRLPVLQWLQRMLEPDEDGMTLDWGDCDHIILKSAALSDNVAMLAWLAARPGILLSHKRNLAFRTACGAGHMPVIRWFVAQPRVRPDANDYAGLELAVAHGHEDVFRWFVAETNALDEFDEWFNLAGLAVQNRHLPLLIAMASELGPARMPLHESDNYLVKTAANTGQPEMCTWLLSQPSVTLDNEAIEAAAKEAAKRNDLPMIIWLRARAVLEYGQLFGTAAENNATDVMQWLWEDTTVPLPEDSVTAAFVAAASLGRRESIQWILRRDIGDLDQIHEAQTAARQTRKWTVYRMLEREEERRVAPKGRAKKKAKTKTRA